MNKLLLTLIMMFTFGTSIVNAEENTTSIEDRIDELVETKPASQSAIKTKVDKLSKAELKAVIENVDELTEPTEDDLIIKETAISKLKEMKSKTGPRHNYPITFYPITFLFLTGGTTLIYFILVKLGLMD